MFSAYIYFLIYNSSGFFSFLGFQWKRLNYTKDYFRPSSSFKQFNDHNYEDS